MLSPTLNFEVGQIAAYPIIIDEDKEEIIENLVDENRLLSKADWDAFESSWDYVRNPLI